MEFDELSNQVIGDCEDGTPDELQSCLFLLIHSKRQRAKERPLSF
jgi:hypothetical protein